MEKLAADEQAKLFFHGAIVLLEGLPPKSVFGIDCKTWHVGEKFRGVKMIPPGVHFITCAAVSDTGQRGSAVSRFVNLSTKEIYVCKWNQETEDFFDSRDLEPYQGPVEALDPHLGGYPLEQYRKWVSLSSHLSFAVLTAVLPPGGTIYAATQLVSQRKTFSKAARYSETEQSSSFVAPDNISEAEKQLPQMRSDERTSLQYTTVDRRKFPTGLTPREISASAIDGSYHLREILQSRYAHDHTGFLGEIQLSFLCFLLAENLDSFEQWKRLVALACDCEEALHTHSDLFLGLIKVLHFQLKEVPRDFFVDIVAQNNFLTTTLHRLFSNVAAGRDHLDSLLVRRCDQFHDSLTTKFNWDFGEDPNEDGPIVVESDDGPVVVVEEGEDAPVVVETEMTSPVACNE